MLSHACSPRHTVPLASFTCRLFTPEYTFDLIIRSRVLVQLTGKNHFPEGYDNTIQFLITVETNISAHILPYVVVTTPSPQALEPI